MESLKELLTPKSFNKLSFVAVFFWILFGVTLLGIFADAENSESRFDFSCGSKSNKDFKDLIEGKCFQQYEKRYNKLSVPVYGFVIANFSVIAIVSVIYSQSVKSRVNELEDAELGQVHQENPTRRRLFIAYFSQLAFRICFGILFIILQTQVFYPRNFPSNFMCELMPTSGNNSVTPSTNITPDTQVVECQNQRASKKTFWTNAVSVVNGIFVFLVFLEIVLILSRARKWGKKFMEDEQFFADHLKAKPPADPQQLPLLPSLSAELQAFMQTMKNRVIKGTEQPTDLDQPINRPSPGERSKPKDLKLDDIYTNLKIQEGRVYYDFPKDRREQLKIYPKPNVNNSEFTRPEDIIDADHKNILVVGRPGIGKTLFCSKLLRDWASDKVFNNEQNLEPGYDVAFLLKFRRLSQLAEHTNLRELLCDYSEYSANVNDEVWEYILKNPNKVLLMFDGTDELPRHSEIATEDYRHYRNTAAEEMPVLALYKKIADGKLLSGATVITTTRPTAVSSLTHLKFDRVVEILGFNSQQVEDYVTRFTKDGHGADGAKETIWQHISGNLNLFSLSYIPVNCFIICSCLFYLLRTCGRSRLPTQLTEIYSIAIKVFFSRHSSEKYRTSIINCDQFVFKQFRELPSPVQDVFKRLGEIAYKGIEEGKLIFGPSEVEGLEDCGLLHRLPDRAGHTPFALREQQFCFSHLTIQEFFAAKHLTDTLDDGELRTFVSDKIGDGAWTVVTQFIAGLLKEREVSLTHIFTDLLPAKTLQKQYHERELTGIWDQTSEYSRPTCWPVKEDKELALNLSKCLHEIDVNNSVIKERLAKIDFSAVDFSACGLAPVDCAAVVHLLKNAEGISCMTLARNNVGPLACMEIVKFVKNNNNLTRLNLASNNIGDKGIEFLCKGLKQSNCKLETLNLAHNNIADKGEQHLCEALKQSSCKLKTLILAFNNITATGVGYLCEALKQSNCKLKTLILTANNITDKGVEYFSEALKHNNCKLETLSLGRNNLTDNGVEYFCEALKNSNCKLETLNLADNKITDNAVEHLGEALKQSDCKLKTLDLASNNITDKGVAYLCEALRHNNCKLETLNLYENNITDKGVEYLCEAVKRHLPSNITAAKREQSNCKLKRLNLQRNNISEKGKDLLHKAQGSLTKIDI